MPRPVKTEVRPYRSALRAEHALETRRRVIEAATKLFLAQGYARTTVAAVAAEADVSPETVYATLRTKRGLLEAVMDATIDAHVAPLRHPGSDPGSPWEAIGRLPNPRKRLRAWAELVADVLSRTSPLHAVIRGAADSEPFAVELRERLLQRRLADIAISLERYVGKDLRPDLTEGEAVARTAALTSPELHHLLTAELGWTKEQHREWLSTLLDAELLKPGRR